MPDALALGRLMEISEAIGRIEAYIAGVEEQTFLEDREKIDAVALNLLVMGEAVRGLPADLLARSPQIPWPRVVALRNRIAHGYAGLQFPVIWSIARRELPTLRAAVTELINALRVNGAK